MLLRWRAEAARGVSEAADSDSQLVRQKRRMRAEMEARRRAVAPEAAAVAGRAACQHLLAEPRFLAAKRVALFAATAEEIPTRPLFDALSQEGRALVFPRCLSGRRLEFVGVGSWDELCPGRYGLLEPPEGAPVIRLSEGDAAVVPGVAFDSDGNRLGRGGGFYDGRFPAAEPAPLLIGFAYEFQVVEAVPHGPRDRRVDAVVTDAALRWVGALT